MKIREFFEELTLHPQSKFTCSAFRSIAGVVFVRQESGTIINVPKEWGDNPDLFPISVSKFPSDTMYHTCEPYWVLGAVIEDDVILTHDVFDEHQTGRNRYDNGNARNNWVYNIAKGKVHIKVKRGTSPALEPHSRKLKDRYGMIKDALWEGIRGQSTWQHVLTEEDLALLLPAEEWWNLAWAYAFTDAAKRVVDCENKIAASLTKVSFDNLTNIDSKLKAVRNKVSASDFEEAQKLFDPLKKQINALSELTNEAHQAIEEAGEGMSFAHLPAQEWRLSEGGKHNTRFWQNYYSVITISTAEEESLLGGYEALSALFNKIGLPISAPYGVEICPENIGKLAVLNETVKEIILTPPKKEEDEPTEVEPVNLLF